jgi:hypothetical protein
MNDGEVSGNDVLYIEADVHERETQVAIFEPGGTLLEEKRILTRDLQSYVHSLPAKEKHLALGSLGFIYPLYDKLKQVPGCDVAVANPKRIRQVSDSKQKHDRADAKLLGNLFRTNYLKRSYMSDLATREKRFLINDRAKYGLRRSELRGRSCVNEFISHLRLRSVRSEVTGVNHGAFGCMDNEPIGTRDGMIHVNRFYFNRAHFQLVACVEGSELQSFNVVVEGLRRNFA